MAFQGYLIAFRNNSNVAVPFPLKFMRYETYDASVNVQDLDSTLDTRGYLHRTVLDHTRTKVTFTMPSMNLARMKEALKYFTDAFGWNGGNVKGRECYLYWYDYWTDSYKGGTFYMPGTIQFPIRNINEDTNDINFGEVKISFIEK